MATSVDPASDADELLPFDGTCPACAGQSEPGQRYDGEEYRCGGCGVRLVAVAYQHEMRCGLVDRGAVDGRTGRQTTRARWTRRGRR